MPPNPGPLVTRTAAPKPSTIKAFIQTVVKPGSHDLAVYLGTVTVQGHAGSAPMSVTFALSREVPMEVLAELTARPR